MLEAIRRKNVVTANKALLATHGNEIFKAAQKKGVMVAFEARSRRHPDIKALREGLAANRVEWIAGIITTSNFILSEMRGKGLPFGSVLKEAQKKGYAETDPTFDIEGVDAAHKLTILSALAFGTPMQFAKAYTEGISKLTQQDIRYAEQLGYRIKLLGITKRKAKGIELRVHPTLVPKDHLLAKVDGVLNSIIVKGDAVGQTGYYGAGAGSQPTATRLWRIWWMYPSHYCDPTIACRTSPSAHRLSKARSCRSARSRPPTTCACAAGPRRRAGRRDAHPGRPEDLHRRDGAEEPEAGETGRHVMLTHARSEERRRRHGEDREAADRGRQGPRIGSRGAMKNTVAPAKAGPVDSPLSRE